VIFMSSLTETEDKVRGLEAGAADYIVKPFQPEEVIARVNTHLSIHRLKQNLARKNEELDSLPQEDAVLALVTSPVPVSFTVLEEKFVGRTVFPGRLSSSGRKRPELPPRPWWRP
jgi:DNA-binding response OmpR family regulator